uniref:Uncharacterized protein n=1 Tax=Rhizophora mucronata TaxID=61149 RepID=A0A2P2P053_RHIMU
MLLSQSTCFSFFFLDLTSDCMVMYIGFFGIALGVGFFLLRKFIF